MNKFRFGIAGCGMISEWHANAIKQIDEAELAGAADIDKYRAEKFCRKFETEVFDSFEDLLQNKDIDIICICTPSGLHAQQAIAAANAGKHIVIEKPMALNLIQADEIIAACRKNRVNAAVVSQLRFSDAIKRLKVVVDGMMLGKLVMGDIYMKYYRSQEYYDRGKWRGTWDMDGGGALMNQGIHGVDLLQYIMGPVKSVFAYTRTLARKIEVEDTVASVVEFRNGALGIIQATTSIYPGYPRRLEISGDKGSIIVEEDSIVKWDVEGSPCPEGICLRHTSSSSANNPAAFGNEGHLLQISDMISSLKKGQNPLVNQYEGRKSIEIIDAIYKSSRTGKSIEIGI